MNRIQEFLLLPESEQQPLSAEAHAIIVSRLMLLFYFSSVPCTLLLMTYLAQRSPVWAAAHMMEAKKLLQLFINWVAIYNSVSRPNSNRLLFVGWCGQQIMIACLAVVGGCRAELWQPSRLFPDSPSLFSKARRGCGSGGSSWKW